MIFVGRSEELEVLRAKQWHGQATLIVVYGRRRVGKSRLIEEAYRSQNLIVFDGLEGQNQRAQLLQFYNQLLPHLQRYGVAMPTRIGSWYEALDALLDLIKAAQGEEIIIFFDEFQWMAEMKSTLVSIFKSYWDRSFVKFEQLKFILCGSVSAFIVKKVIRSKALYGRIDRELHICALNSFEIQEFLGSSFAKPEILNMALTLGGIPEYLERLNPDLSALQNLAALAFTPQGYLLKEYSRIFVSHFGRSEVYAQAISALSESPLSHKELERKIVGQAGGSLTAKLEALALAGFIERYVPVDKPKGSKLVWYRLNDEYLHFYFTFLHPRLGQIQSGEVVPEQILLGSRYDQWLGYAFERLCRKNSRCIAEKLGFSGISYHCGSWFNREVNGPAQVDLLFVRSDRVVLACELKYGARLDSGKLAVQLERQHQALRRSFPRHALKHALILAQNIAIPPAAAKLFAHTLHSDQLFFR